jgi:foldase protein PrsA
MFAVAAVAVTGCGTFSDTDVAARVGDDELSNDELVSIVRERLGDPEAEGADMQTVAEILNNWVLDRVLRADLAASDNAIDDLEGELTDTSLIESVNESVSTWQQIPAAPISDDELGALYARGPVDSGVSCTAHILVDEEATADEVVARLDDGDDFAELAAEFSVDSSAANGGNLPCVPTAEFAAQYVPEYVEAALDAEIGEPVGPVQSQFGFHVILVRPFDEIGADEIAAIATSPQVRFGFATRNVDVFVDPRYGTFDGARGVVPLG